MIANYYEIRENFKPGDLIAFSGNSLIAKAIKFFTHSSITHVATILDMNIPRTRWIIGEAIEKGVQPRYLSDKIEHFKGKSIYWCPLQETITDEQRMMATNYIWNAIFQGVGYDYYGLLTWPLHKISVDYRTFLCSELNQVAYTAAEIIEPQEHVLSPEEITKLPIFGIKVRI